MIKLLAYPRSGSSFFRYSVGYLTQSPPIQPQGHCEFQKEFGSDYCNPPVIEKHHYPYDSKKLIIGDSDVLLLLKRNPIENIFSYMFSNEHMNRKGFENLYISEFINSICIKKPNTLKKYYKKYKENINFYKKFDGSKDVIFYENFIKNPQEELQKIFPFTKIDPVRFSDFINNFPVHQNRMLQYKKQDKDPFSVNTDGVCFDKFTKLLSEKNLKMISKMINRDKLNIIK